MQQDLQAKAETAEEQAPDTITENTVASNSALADSEVSAVPFLQRVATEIYDWLDVITSAIIIVIVLFSFLFRVATIDGRSMMNTLYNGEKVIISNFGYTPKQKDIVVISRNMNNSVLEEETSELPIIKRVIAVEGQTVDIDFIRGVVTVDGEELDEPYVRQPTLTKYEVDFPVKVKEGCIFVMGDNRNESLDSRSDRIGDHGMVDTRYVLGHAIFRIFPFNKIGGLTHE
ncbi:MAG: signal peptidase I [Clostridia bacterium]|nr:signal peptidase I [Clostridia bacterium]